MNKEDELGNLLAGCLAFADEAGAKAWLSLQPQAQPRRMQTLLLEQLQALERTPLPPALSLSLLNLLHAAAVPAQLSLESRYARKALPLPDEDAEVFSATQQLWSALGLSYLKLAAHLPAREKLQPLLRASNAFRLAQYCHFQAGRACPPALDELLFTVLQQAESADILRQSLTDPDFPQLGESNVVGLVAWAFLLRLLDPYHLTAHQFIVANRAISRWRGLCSFLSANDDSPKARCVPLAWLLGASSLAGAPCWMNVRSVSRKIMQRIEALREGASPESLKLGRELSTAACIRLLTDMDEHLTFPVAIDSGESGPVDLIFGPERAYAVFAQEYLNPEAGMDVKSTAIANQRMAIFGFDQVSRLATAVQRLVIPSETWSVNKGLAIRTGEAGARRQSPCLIAEHASDHVPRLGVMQSLQADAEGSLTASLVWYAGQVEAACLQSAPGGGAVSPRIPVFLLYAPTGLSMILPAMSSVQLGVAVQIKGRHENSLLPTEVLERGIDFVRYGARPA